MVESEEHLRERNEIAASIGQTIVIDMLKKYRERFISQMILFFCKHLLVYFNCIILNFKL